MSKHIYYIFGGIALIGAGIIGLFWQLNAQSTAVAEAYQALATGEQARDRAALEQFWREHISDDGTDAYAQFAQAVSGFTPGQQHEHAHVFGGTLYETLGLAGLAVCDQRFLYGCYHEFLGRAINERGIGVAGELNQSCLDILGESAHFCQHGIGHGLQAHFGYTDVDLKAALDICQTLSENDPIGGCNGGVFMEYNLHTMLGDISSIREEEDVFAPCNDLAEPYLPACHFWQPQWWMQHEPATSETMSRIGDYCERMNGKSALQYRCFEGIGNLVAPAVDFDGERILELCRATSADVTLRAACIAQGASRAVQGRDKMSAEAICTQVRNVESAQLCEEYVARAKP